MTGVLVLVATLLVASAAGLVLRARNGRMRSAVADSAPGIDLRAFGAEPGSRATLLQFSSAFCAPCRTTRVLLSDVAGAVPGVRHVEIDVANGDAAMELVRRLDIRRTPTTLILDAQAQEVRRASGVPRRDQVLATLAELETAGGVGDEPATSASGAIGDVR